MFKTKKLNNKGVTLVELIVSFALVSIAIIYFYQTLTTVTKMYANAKKDTKKTANQNYALRLVNEYLDLANTFIIDITSYTGGAQLHDPDVKKRKLEKLNNVNNLIVKTNDGSYLVFKDCFDGWNDAFKRINSSFANTKDARILKYPRAINFANVVDDERFSDKFDDATLNVAMEFIDGTDIHGNVNPSNNLDEIKRNYLIDAPLLDNKSENDGNLYKGGYDGAYTTDLNNNLNPVIIQKILFYLNYYLPANKAEVYNNRFTSWWCTYDLGTAPFNNCFKKNRDTGDEEAMESDYYIFRNGSVMNSETRYFIQYRANSKTPNNALSSTNAYNYTSACFNNPIYIKDINDFDADERLDANGNFKASHSANVTTNINEIDEWIPIRLQYLKINFDDFRDKFGIKNAKDIEGNVLKALLYNPKKKLIKVELEHEGVNSTYYKFYDINDHSVTYYSAWLIEKPETKKSHQFTMFLASFK